MEGFDVDVREPSSRVGGTGGLHWSSRTGRGWASRGLMERLSMLWNDVLLIRAEEGVLEVMARPEIMDDGVADVVWLQEGQEGKGRWNNCKIIRDAAVWWDLVTFSCDILDEAHLDARVPGWVSVVSAVVRSQVIARKDVLKMQLGGRPVRFMLNCSSHTNESKEFGCCHFATPIVRQRLRLVETHLESFSLDEEKPNFGGIVGLSSGTNASITYSVIEALVRRVCSSVCVWTAQEATANEDVLLLVSQLCGVSLLLLGVDAVVGDPSRVNKLSQLLERRADSAVVILSAADAAVLPPILSSKIDKFVRVVASQQLRDQQGASNWQLNWKAFDATFGHEDVVQKIREALATLHGSSSSSCSAARVLWLYGEAGCGKTHLCRVVERAVNDPKRVHTASIAKLVHGYIGDSEKALSALFQTARDGSPSVVLMDAAHDLFGNLRNGLFSQLVQEIDALRHCGASVLVVLTSPGPLVSRLGPTLLQGGRIDDVLPLGPPSATARQALLNHMGLADDTAPLLLDDSSFGSLLSTARRAKLAAPQRGGDHVADEEK